jgi:hypothetical protein
LPGLEKINVEIEHIISDDSKQFFKELNANSKAKMIFGQTFQASFAPIMLCRG